MTSAFKKDFVGLSASSALLLVLSSPANAQSQDIQSPLDTSGATKNQFLGSWLEDKFSQMIDTCHGSSGGLKLLKAKKSDKPDNYISATSIPRPLLINYGLLTGSKGKRILTRSGANISNYLGYVYTAQQIANLEVGSTGFYLEHILLGGGKPITIPGTSSASTLYTCNGVVAGALDTKAGYTLPFASLKGSLNSATESSNAYALQLLSTGFNSPVFLAYKGNPTSGISKFHASMMFLDWYRRNPDRLNDDNRVITKIDGHALTRQLDGKKKSSINAEITAKAGFLGFASGKANGRYSKEYFTDISFTNFDIAVSQKDDGKFEIEEAKLPTVAEIFVNLSSIDVPDSIDENRNEFTVYDRSTLESRATLKGVSSNLCASAFWKPASLSNKDIDLTISRKSHSIDENGVPSCTFDLFLKPTAQYQTKSGKRVSIELIFTTTEHTGSPAVINIGDITLHGNRIPILNYVTTPSTANVPNGPIIAGGTTTSELNWDWKIEVKDEGKLSSNNQLDFSGLDFSCDGMAVDTKPSITYELFRNSPDTQTIMTKFKFMYEGDYGALAGNMKHRRCNWSGDIVFTIDGTDIDRPMTSKPLLLP